MADNYLEKRQAEIAEGGRKVVRRTNPSLDTLLHRNRSYRGYDPSRKVTEEELRKLVSAAALAAPMPSPRSSVFDLALETGRLPACAAAAAAAP